MREYDIYIHRQMEKIKLLIYSIPYREVFSVSNQILLNAVVNYVSAQKAFAVSVQAEVAAELDDMLATVRERVRSGLELRADTVGTLKYRVDAKAIKTEIGLSEPSTLGRNFFEADSAVGLLVSDVSELLKSPLGDGRNEMTVLSTYLADTKLSKEQATNRILLSCSAPDLKKQSYEQVRSRFCFTTSSPDLFYFLTLDVQARLSIGASLAPLEVHYPLGDGTSQLGIEVSVPNGNARKFVELTNEAAILCELRDTVELHFPVKNQFQIAMYVSAGLKRFRLLYEADPLSLLQMDDMTLGELDYVVLEE